MANDRHHNNNDFKTKRLNNNNNNNKSLLSSNGYFGNQMRNIHTFNGRHNRYSFNGHGVNPSSSHQQNPYIGSSVDCKQSLFIRLSLDNIEIQAPFEDNLNVHFAI